MNELFTLIILCFIFLKEENYLFIFLLRLLTMLWSRLNPINIFVEFFVYLIIDNITKIIVSRNKYIFILFNKKSKNFYLEKKIVLIY
jgi:hypothetical protein